MGKNALWLALSPLLFLVLGCSRTRPAPVPRAAVWVGGPDGGVYIFCTPSINGEANKCTVYNDSNGGLYMNGEYVITGTSRGARKEELHFIAADGVRIYLENKIVLVPVVPPKKDE